jgi:GNAT superfamily N-acetyltransferase
VLVHLLPPRLCGARAGLRGQPRAEETAGRGRTGSCGAGDEAIAWAEYGTPDELPTIHHRKQYLAEADVIPDYRITCIFVDKRHRGQGYAKVALAGALDLIAAQGGGVVEGYPHETGEKRMSNSFVYNGTRTMYEQAGFGFVRSKGMKNTVMRRTIQPA